MQQNFQTGLVSPSSNTTISTRLNLLKKCINHNFAGILSVLRMILREKHHFRFFFSLRDFIHFLGDLASYQQQAQADQTNYTGSQLKNTNGQIYAQTISKCWI